MAGIWEISSYKTDVTRSPKTTFKLKKLVEHGDYLNFILLDLFSDKVLIFDSSATRILIAEGRQRCSIFTSRVLTQWNNYVDVGYYFVFVQCWSFRFYQLFVSVTLHYILIFLNTIVPNFKLSRPSLSFIMTMFAIH